MSVLFVQPAPPATRGRRMLAPALTIGGLALATLALHLRDPHQHASWGLCPSAVMGVYCPGCGGLRAVNDLTNGHIGAALSSNLVVTLMVPVAVVVLGIWATDRWQGRSRHLSWHRLRRGAYGFLFVLAVFTVLRNIPIGSWLAP